MHEDIRYWRGKRITELGLAELREALAEVYRELEQLSWLAHQQRKVIEKDHRAPKRRGKPAMRQRDVDAPQELEGIDAA